MIIVYRAANPQEAHIVAGMLRAEGIDAHASGTFLQGGIGELPASDFAVVRVPEEQASDAKVRIEAYDSGAVEGVWDTATDQPDLDPHLAHDKRAWQRIVLFIAAVSLAVLLAVSLF